MNCVDNRPYASASDKKARYWARFKLPDGQEYLLIGQQAKALAALLRYGSRGVTALEMSGWAFRLGAYIHELRTKLGLYIQTIQERHDFGWHARYVLHSPVILLGDSERGNHDE